MARPVRISRRSRVWLPWLGFAGLVLLASCLSGGYPDLDGDGSPDAEDCAPDDPGAHPGAVDPYGNGVDENCDGVDGFDGDGDGFAAQDDCNDADATINPAAEEAPGNGIDEDCDGFDAGDAVDDDDDATAGDDDDASRADDDDATVADIEGNEPGECGDGADNDGDGLFDCDDPDCAGAPACEEELNSPPTAPDVAVVPESPHSTHPLNCLVVVPSEDPDGDLVSYTWTWSKNGVDAGISDVVVPASQTSTGDDWLCSVTPHDGFEAGPPGVDTVTVTNEPPTAPQVAIVPSSPITTDELNCVVQVQSIDPEGLAVNYAFSWSVDGSPSGHTAAVVPATDTFGGQAWTCSVTPNDGGDDGPDGVAAATVVIPVGCADGSVEEGSSWGRDDIVYCDGPGLEYGTVADCGLAWHVCSDAEFMAKNDGLVGGSSFWASLTGNCIAWHSADTSDAVSAASDLIYDNEPGTCSGTLGNPNSSNNPDIVGRRAPIQNCASAPDGRCGVLCCYD